ncbi:hypothetical protein P154DRAFT_532824 [Amniculicola lignicola CBS 123094]|uniref:Lysine-specific metallo-endopeptidase domain-containing protein n=1 Tax=Amniculicola lignicola CBS 123094 TaxID=1392246 RepID=A0A6A5WU22_9PLEO|nr:hypothetical protein P154DRAFT_532824 [Amniculicola lignicola CBS 123094]
MALVKVLSLSSMLLLVSYAIAAPVHGSEISQFSLTSYWEPHPGSLSEGGCDDHIEDLKVSWGEACLASNKAKHEIKWLGRTGFLTQGKGPSPSTDKEERERWDRVYNTYIALFGEIYDKKGRELRYSDHDTRIRRVYKFYSMMSAACKTKPNPKKKPQNLFCGDAWLTWIPVGYPDPEQSEKMVEETQFAEENAVEAGGIWYNDLLDEGRRRLILEPPTNSNDPKICNGELACTFVGQSIVIWCPPGLSQAPSVLATEARIKSVPFTSELDAMAKVKDGTLTSIYSPPGTSGGDMIATWIHEMGHHLMGWIDEQAVNRRGKRKWKKGHDWDTRKQKWVASEKTEVLVTSWKLASQLATWDPDKAVMNPENYAFFGMAMLLDDWDWHHGGYAQPIKRVP